LLEAWQILSKDLDPYIHLVVAGAKGASQVFAQSHLGPIPPRVHFTGYIAQEQLPMLYSGATAFVYPSLYEGFGLPPLEAMACGCPVITSDTTSLPEVAGTASALVDPTSADSIAGGLWRVLSNETLRQDMVSRGRIHASQQTWDRSAAATRKILLENA
jgi:glycosyltransferase involved in cell wall biosynthesis